MKLSLVIFCHNEACTIGKNIETVLCTPYQDKEIIVVDFFSTDGTRDFLKN